MRAYRSWRYRCDYCKKAGGSKFHMAKHEKGCTARPDRICGICDKDGLWQKTSAEIVNILDTEGFNAMKKYVHNCPACILAGLRQTKLDNGDNEGRRHDWDFKKAIADWSWEPDSFQVRSLHPSEWDCLT